MIKARLTKEDGTQFFLLGLSEENIQRMRQGYPIMFDGSPFGVMMNVVIVTGKDEMTIAKTYGITVPQ